MGQYSADKGVLAGSVNAPIHKSGHARLCAARPMISVTLILYEPQRKGLLTVGIVALFLGFKYRRHLIRSALYGSFSAPYNTECAYHSKSTYRDSNVRMRSSVLGISKKHFFSPFFVVFLVSLSFYFLFTPLTKVSDCCKIILRKILDI